MLLLNKLVVAALPAIPRPLIRYFAGRYIAGETLDEAVSCVRGLNRDGVCATLDVLGEDVTTEEEAIASREQSSAVLHAIARERIDSNLSIKLTSLGLKLGKSFCTGNVREILNVAGGYGTFVRFDMEDSTCTTDTIDIFKTLHREYPHTGIVIQAYLRRSGADAADLLNDHPNFRLCKGIYRERKEIAYQEREEIREQYRLLLDAMLDGQAYVGIATHDAYLLDAARSAIAKRGLRKDQYEFQMLLGVRPELRRQLVKEGHRVRLYVPFGRHWYGYSVRRFKENPEIAGYVFRALFKRNT